MDSKETERKTWKSRFLNLGSVGLMTIGGLIVLGAQQTVGLIVEKWFDGELIIEPVYMSGIAPEGEICKATFQFVNNMTETVLVNEFHFKTIARGEPKDGKALLKLEDLKPEKGPDGLMLPNLGPDETRTRSTYRKTVLKPGEAGEIELILYPPRISYAVTVGEYEVTPTVVTSAGSFELEPATITVGQTVFDSPSRRPSTLYLENEDGMFDIIDSGL